jgi:hypothetical protein
MGTFKASPPQKLTIYPWGDGVGDIRYFTPQILMPSELAAMKDASYVPQAYDFESAKRALELTMKDAEPGIYFAGNPLESTYGKWLCVMRASEGWTQVPGCALNRVWGNWQAYKGPGSKNTYGTDNKNPWDSPDGFNKWVHAFYYIVPGRKEAVKFDFTAKTRDLNATNGDVDLHKGAKGSLWHINYGGSPKVFAKYPPGKPAWCHNYARLSKSCGVAMGYGLPDCGEALDEEFYCIAAQELDKAWPKGWNSFLEYGGLSWSTNLTKLSTAQPVCPHPMSI